MNNDRTAANSILPVNPSTELEAPEPSRATESGSVEFKSASVPPRNDHEKRIFEIWCKVLDKSSFGVTDSFYDLGGDSLKAVTMLVLVEGEFDVSLPPVQVLYTPTIEKLAGSISRGSGVINEEQKVRSIVALRVGTNRAPLFCFPGVGGDVNCFRLLAERLDIDQGVQGVLYRYLESDPVAGSMEALASSCLAGIKGVQPKGPYHLGGYSFGGSVAYEVAQQLRSAGEHVALLALWDTELDADRLRMRTTRFLLDIRGIASWSWRKKLTYMKGEFADRIRCLVAGGVPKSQLSPTDVDGRMISRMVRFQSAAMAIHIGYKHLPYEGRVSLFCADDKSAKKDLSYWLRLARGGIEAYSITGEHATMFLEPNISYLAEVVKRCLTAR